jgi:hypothetical protein
MKMLKNIVEYNTDCTEQKQYFIMLKNKQELLENLDFHQKHAFALKVGVVM